MGTMAPIELEKVNFGYSLKNIPIHSNKAYLKSIVEKLESFISRLRWKVFFYLKEREKPENESSKENKPTENFGFKSENALPASKDLKQFENDLYDLVKNIQFRNPAEVKRRNSFRKQLSKDIREIKSSNDLFIPADKTTNIYKMKSADYEKFLTNSITTQYKKVRKAL